MFDLFISDKIKIKLAKLKKWNTINLKIFKISCPRAWYHLKILLTLKGFDEEESDKLGPNGPISNPGDIAGKIIILS